MKKFIKYGAFGLGGLLALLLIVVAVVAATFNPNDYKQYIIDLVKEKKDRTLTLEGDIKLAFWPKIGANLGKVSISEHKGTAEFAAVEGVQVSLALLPLLKKELVVDTVYIDGARANIVKYKDGTTNFDDLLSKEEEEESPAIQFDVDGVNVTNSSVNYSDEGTGAKYSLSEFNLKAGHVALAQPIDVATDFTLTANQPAIAAKAKIKGVFLADPETKHFAANKLDVAVTGDVAGGKDVNFTLAGDIDTKPETKEFLIDGLKVVASGVFSGAKLNVDLNAPELKIEKETVTSRNITLALAQVKGDDNFKANVVMANIIGTPKSLQSTSISGDIAGTQGKRNISGEFSSPFKGNLETLVFDLPKLAGEVSLKDASLPNGGLKAAFDLGIHADVKQEQVSSTLKLKVDNSNINGKVGMTTFAKPRITFDINIDQLDLDQYAPKGSTETKTASSTSASKPVDLSALKALNADGSLKIGSLKYGKTKASNIRIDLKADGEKLSVSPLAAKVDDSQINASIGITQFSNPIYSFNINIDQLDADKYITKSDAPAAETKTASNKDAPIDLSALKKLNASGEAKIGSLKIANVKTQNVVVGLKANGGVVTVWPFSANLYQGSMDGLLKVDARATPVISFKQDMRNIAIGPLLVDAINNNMLDGKGTLNVDVTTTGNTVGALKKALGGSAAVNLADGAIKGVDIAGTIRDAKNKLNVFKDKSTIGADQTKKTDFSELTASFSIKNGVAHNEDLAMKAPILRLGKGDSRGDIDIGNETINYLAKPTIVKSLKGQGGDNLDDLAGVGIPVKITGTFAAPKFGIDFAALGAAITKSKLLDKVGGSKAEAVKGLVGGDKTEALKGLLGKPKTDSATGTAAPKSGKEDTKKKLGDMLGF